MDTHSLAWMPASTHMTGSGGDEDDEDEEEEEEDEELDRGGGEFKGLICVVDLGELNALVLLSTALSLKFNHHNY